MVFPSIELKEALRNLPKPWPIDPIPDIQEEIRKNPVRVFSLDDDPTGSQTVENVSLLTDWSVESLEKQQKGGSAAFSLTITEEPKNTNTTEWVTLN